MTKAQSALELRGVRRARARRFGVTALLLVASLASFGAATSCKRKVSQKQCDELLDRFSELVVKERMPDAGADALAAERVRERDEAKTDDAFKNCTSEVQVDEHACAMKAATSEALIKCLE
jgi:hypothetical protein